MPIRNYRSSPEIISSLLEAMSENGVSTHLMREANVSFAQLKKYLGYCEKVGLIRAKQNSQGRPCYEPTEKAKSFLTDYKRIESYMSQLRA